MKVIEKSEKNCIDCGKLITFETFCKENPSISLGNAEELWENPLISVYCYDCFFKRPEKPFKKRTRYYKYVRMFRSL